ncbi:MAG: FAD-dependent thymidylate synthase [Deltaproteobacteria bacterium]|nr:FAD-dependent thymidylate synthase [Deltaproteobacteria bacterium]
MDILLAGFNVDYETLQTLTASHPGMDNITPETISAAYARISRNPLPVNELRAISRREIEKARRSNESIVFDMGHSSIAEHAVFNIDVLGVSRLIVEEIEKFRLCSFTEKSQRYIRLEDDFVIPAELVDDESRMLFRETVKEQNALYHDLFRALREYFFDTHRDLAEKPSHRMTLEGWAKEDARYIVSLATETQLGMTLNARNLELMLRRSAAHHLAEMREYGARLYDATRHIAPSLVRYTEATPYDLHSRNELREHMATLAEQKNATGGDPVILLHATPGADDIILSSLLHSLSNRSMEQCRKTVSRLTTEEKKDIIKTACRRMEAYDSPPREFENADILYELTISASCFAQLKRHRLATITSQQYDPALGVTVPPSIEAVNMNGPFMERISRTNEVYERIARSAPAAAPYILTNAHRKRVIMKVNVRELYHISRLREDRHAQWDIRETARHMVMRARKVMPLSLLFACGKDSFADLRESILD